jgi:nucleotide-binding universal stress UspA family protein
VSTDRILVGYQGGGAGADAVRFARRWAASCGDRVDVVTVRPGKAPIGIGRVDAEWDAYEREEAHALQDRARQMLEGVEATFRVVDASSSAHGLADLTEEGEGTMLVLGARRTRDLRRTYPGSTAERLLHGAALPITLIPNGYADVDETPITRVTVAYVDSPDGTQALSVGARIARHLGAGLRALTVLPSTRMFAGEVSEYRREAIADYRATLERAVAGLEGVEAVAEVREGGVVDELAGLGPAETDLLVCGSRGYGPVARVFLGGVSGRLVRHARVPLTVVPRPTHP